MPTALQQPQHQTPGADDPRQCRPHLGHRQHDGQATWGKANNLIQDHDFYLELDRAPAARQYAYRERFKHPLPDAQLHDIRECLAYNFPLGNDRFREAIETALGRRVGERKRAPPSSKAKRGGSARLSSGPRHSRRCRKDIRAGMPLPSVRHRTPSADAWAQPRRVR